MIKTQSQFHLEIESFYLYEGFERVKDTACSNQKEPIIDNLSTASLYCAAHEDCGGFFDNQGMGTTFVLCFQPVKKLKDFTTKGTILYIKSGESNENYSLSNNFDIILFSIETPSICFLFSQCNSEKTQSCIHRLWNSPTSEHRT